MGKAKPVPNLYLSNTARAGVQGFAKTLSEELGPTGLTVNTILPGFTRTDRLKGFVKEIQAHSDKTEAEIEAGWAAGNALKRIGEPDEFAAAVAFLVSARAGYVTGIADAFERVAGGHHRQHHPAGLYAHRPAEAFRQRDPGALG